MNDHRAGPEDPHGPEPSDALDGDEPGDDYVEVRPEPGRARKVLTVLGALAAALALVLGGTALWVRGQLDPGSPGEEVVFTIPPGATTDDVARLLADEGIVTNATIFRFYVRYRGAGPFQAGDYDGLRRNSAMADVIDRLERGPLPPGGLALTIPEGLRLDQVRERILAEIPEMDAAALDQALAQVRSRYQPEDAPSLEGFLFPDTYQIDEDDVGDELALVTRMVEQTDRVLDELGYAEENPWGLSAYELVTIASLIERESRIAEEFGMVSRVIHNRLDLGMTLGIDATILYEIGHTDTLTRSDLETDSPYNTRLYAGLPPTPIAMPGREALRAALHPDDGDWLFYVLADEDGSHFFTDDYDAFLRQRDESRERGLF